ncbi:YceI family protein [Sphaerisporangium corydalis]|uniref:YceI family protein n=1 Tax=Sphaerisporangium corydalis TaxID=1441875 RepID=A0ABV9EK34_9ACTN|nr:YceI family protein [Sphaerisporangium corydalis]
MSTTTLSPEITGQYRFDTAHTRLGFVARHAMVTKVYGAFNEFEGNAYLDAADPSKSHAEVVIEVASVDTRNEQRDGHLRTNDFFDAPTYPKITFNSTAVEQLGAASFRVTGDLTIKDVTRPVSIDFEYTGSAKDAYGNERTGFEGSTVVNRKDFGINFHAVLEAGGVMVSDKITLEFDISAIKVVPEA